MCVAHKKPAGRCPACRALMIAVEGRKAARTPRERAKFKAMVLEGCSKAEVAREFGLSDPSSPAIRRLCRELKVRFKPDRRNLHLRSRLLNLVASGVNRSRDLARLIGRSPALVKRWCSELERDGLLRRTGAGSGTRIIVTPAWGKPNNGG